MIHSTAIIDPTAELAQGVSVGPWSIIGPNVQIGLDTEVASHVVIKGRTRIGCNNKIYQFCSIGDDPQDKKYAGEDTVLEIGDSNVIREYCTLNRGTADGGGTTRVGDDNWIMAYVHIAHDCQVGNHTIMANGTTLAGHATVDDYVIFGAFTVIHQFCAVGAHAFSAMGTVILKDVPPYVTVSGNPAKPHGINTEGLRRRGCSKDTVRELRRAYKIVYKQGLTAEQAREALHAMSDGCLEVKPLRDFLQRSTRGIVR